MELSDYFNEYKNYITKLLKIKKRFDMLAKQGRPISEIYNILGKDAEFLKRIPDKLYHGSPANFDVIKARESTQAGSHVYATDNPIHALFFAIFRNSSEIRGHINERIDENGNYLVNYEIDERIEGAIDKIISDREIILYVCDGKDFFKPKGEAYVSREWCSKTEFVKPIDKITINVKKFFNQLEKEGLITYDRYDKTKDWATILDAFAQNYAFGLTKNEEEIIKLDEYVDQTITTSFPEQFDFSKYIREELKEIMSTDLTQQNPNLSHEEQVNIKLKQIKEYVYSFYKKEQDIDGKQKQVPDIEKITKYIEYHKGLEEKQDDNKKSV